MKRAAKWILGIVAALVLVFAIALAALTTYDWNRAKPWVAKTLTQTLGRAVQVDGELAVRWQRDPDADGWRSWVPTPHVSAGEVTVGNSKWARVPVFGRAKRIEFDIALLPLLRKTVEIQTMRFVEPDAALERLDDGRENWTFTDQPSTWTCTIGRIAIDRAKFTYFDHGAQIDIAGEIDALGEQIAYDQLVAQQVRAARADVLGRIGPKAVRRFEERADQRAAAIRRDGRPPQRYAFNWSARGTLAKQPFAGAGRLGGVFYLRNPEHPFPLLGDIKVGDTHIVLVGTLTDPADLDALDLRLWLAGPNLSHIYAIAGVPLPNSGAYAMEGHLLGQFNAGTTIRYEDFTARIGQSDLSGALRYEAKAPRPLLSGKVVSEELQFRDLAPLIGADGGGKTDASGKLIPAEPFRPDRWRAMDAAVEFSGDHVFRDAELPIHQVDTRITLDNGVLALAPLRFRYAGGDVDSELRFDGSAAPIKASFKLTARGMQLKELLPVATGDEVTLGTAQGSARLDASGDSVGSLLGAASGELKVSLDNGTISKALLETASLNMPNIALAKLFGDQQVKIDCAIADFVATAGVFDARAFVVDTDVAVIRVDGKVDLGRETVDLTIHPDSKGVRLLSLRSPLHVRGPFRKIDVSIDKGALLARAATAIGLAAVAAPAAALVPLTSTNVGSTPNRCEALASQATQTAKAKTPAQRR